MNAMTRQASARLLTFGLALVGAVAVAALLTTGCAKPKPGTYATPEEAVAAFSTLIGTKDNPRTDEVFGTGASDMFHSGDADEDQRMADVVKKLVGEKVAFQDVDDQTKVALFGDKAWPFPIPLVKDGDRWRFDTAAGREELLNRRIGYYELSTLDSLHAYVDAQREYAGTSHDGKPLTFAQRFRSSEGQHDGLYWAVATGEAPSPLGEVLADAATRSQENEPRPYHGYNYRILTAQGAAAPGGAKSYLDAAGNLTGGFAAIAWPAKYGNSGVMTFVISDRGIAYQKDLGPQTGDLAPKIASFDPDTSWEPTGDTLASAVGTNDDLGALDAEEQ
jgi:hypothetical protein